MDRMKNNMLEGRLLPAVIHYTIPVILTSVFQLLFNAVDLVVVGYFCGSASVGAVGATNAVTNLIINLFVGLSVGTGVTVAHGLGSRDEEEVRNTVHTALPMALVGGVLLTAVGVLASEPLLRLLDTPAELLPMSAAYMKVYFGGVTFTVIYNFCAAILRAAGDTRSPLRILMKAGGLNVALNLVFVTVFHMNVAGVALATIVSQGLSAVLVVRALVHRTDLCHLDLRKIRFHGPQILKIIRIGLPAGIQSSMFSLSNATIQSAVNSFGDVFVAGNAAAASIEGFMYVAINSFNQAAVNFVGRNVGAKQHRRAARAVVTCMGCAVTVGLVMSIVIRLIGEDLLGIYITDSPQSIADGMLRITYVCSFYFLVGLMDVSTGALRGYGASLVPMIICLLGVCGIRIGWVNTIFRMPGFNTPQWLYISYPVSWLLTFLAQFTVFLVATRKYRHMEQT